ncbi:GNAT family N-acetyltransferase [soil metagenome]
MIRPGTPGDAEEVARVQVQTWQAAYAHALPHDQLMALSVEERTEGFRRWPPTLVAEADGAVVGYIAVGRTHDESGDGELYAIYVLPAQWGTGVGRALITAGEECLRELGHQDAHLWVLDDNPRARNFYEAAGWAVDGTARRVEFLGFVLDEVRYTKRL